jgi:hypothetical protein
MQHEYPQRICLIVRQDFLFWPLPTSSRKHCVFIRVTAPCGALLDVRDLNGLALDAGNVALALDRASDRPVYMRCGDTFVAPDELVNSQLWFVFFDQFSNKRVCHVDPVAVSESS